jgi:Tfp pilus assembly protein PilF
LQQNQLAEALRCYQEIVRLEPGCFEAQAQSGALLHQAKRHAEAALCLQAALKLQPRFANLNLLLGSVYKEMGRYEEAARCCQREAVLAPNNADVHYNLGLVWQNLDRTHDALAAYQRAVELRPQYVDAWINLGCVQRSLGQPEAARKNFETAVRLAPDHAEAHWELATTCLALGDFERGWPEYEWRWRQPDFTAQRLSLSQPRWDGRPLDGQRILLYAEQGYGDAIQFARYASLVAARGGTVLLGCSAPLQGLLATVPGVAEVVTQFARLPPFAVQAPLMSLPGIFQTTLATVPAQVPYLILPPTVAPNAATDAARPRVGIVWAGRPTHRNDRFRSVSLAVISRLLGQVDCDWFSLQAGPPSAELAELVAAGKIANWGAGFNDFLDAARAVASLDLVVTVDTAVAHLAGAMGKPVWLLLPYEAEWRWLIARPDSPWYPTMRLFRQRQPGDWSEVIERVIAALGQLKRTAGS